MNTEFGKKMSPAKKAMRLKYRKNISLQEAWDEVLKRKPASKSVKTRKSTKSTRPKKLLKKSLDKLSLKKLLALAKKHKVSVYRKGSKVVVKKSTLLKRLKSSKSIKKILESASKSRSKKSSARFGESLVGLPKFPNANDRSVGITSHGRGKHYDSIPMSMRLYPPQGNINYAPGAYGSGLAPVQFGSRFR